MRIAYIIPSVTKHGPIIVLNNIINNISDKVEHIDVYAFDQSNDMELNANVNFIRMNEDIEFNNYDIIHSHMLRPDYYIWKNKNKIKKSTICISTVHQYIYDVLKYSYNPLLAPIFNLLWIKFLKRQDHIVFIARAMQNFYAQEFTNQKLHYINNGIEERQSLSLSPSTSDVVISKIIEARSKYKIIGVVGGLTKIKGFEQVIKALSQLKDYYLVIIGDGKEMKNLVKLAKKTGVYERCLFTGFLSNVEIYYSHFDVFVLPSRSEGFGLVLLEASSNRVPIICSDIETFKEVFPNEALFFKIDDIDSLTDSIIQAFENSEGLTDRAWDKYQKQYTAKIMAENYYTLYKNVCS